MDAMTDRQGLEAKNKPALETIAKAIGVRGVSTMRKGEIIDAILSKGGEAPGGGETKNVQAATRTEATPSGATPNGNGSGGASSRGGEPPNVATVVAESPDASGDQKRGRARGEAEMTSTTAADADSAAVSSSSGPSETTASEGGHEPRRSVDASDGGGEDSREARGGAKPGRSLTSGGGQDSNPDGDEGSGETRTVRKVGGTGAEEGEKRGRRRQRSRQRKRAKDRDRPQQQQQQQRRQQQGGQQRDQRRKARNEPAVDEETGEVIERKGLLDILPDGYGFIRTGGHLPGKDDVYVSLSQIRRFHLRRGDQVTGTIRPPKSDEKFPALLKIVDVNGRAPEEAMERPRFEDLTPLFPTEQLALEVSESRVDVAQRIIDLISPIGKGQRGLIVSPPKAGKTTILKQITQSIEHNNPETHLIVLLVDERPEEVTDMARSTGGEVIASTFDRPAEEHTQVAELTLERAKRLVEYGQDVVIVLDGITRLARAYNLAAPPSGRILSGGVDSAALYPPKKFFGAARNIEEGGSLTILATSLVDTGSRMDEVIFEEFKGTGNMELRLDRRMSEKRVYPAIDIEASSTRQEQLFFAKEDLQRVWKLRRVLSALEGGAGLELLIDKIKSTDSNAEFLREVAKTPAGI